MLQLAALFAFIGLTSFGGGITAYIRRLVVTQKKWMTDEEFLPGLGLVQLLPGANVAGLAVYIGNHLKGALGSAVARSGARRAADGAGARRDGKS